MHGGPLCISAWMYYTVTVNTIHSNSTQLKPPIAQETKLEMCQVQNASVRVHRQSYIGMTCTGTHLRRSRIIEIIR